MQVLCYEDGFGPTKVVHPAPGVDLETVKSLLDVPLNTVFIVVDSNDLPQDRVFRNAWTLLDGEVQIDRSKAESIHLNRLRYLREQQLDKLDIAYMRAVEKGQNPQFIVDLKQQLRDLPETFDLSQYSIEELKLAKPDYLEGDLSLVNNMVL